MKSIQRPPAGLAPAVNLRLYLIVAIILSLLGGIPVAAQVSGSSPTLEIHAPAQVAVGQPIEITLTMRHATDIGGYETALLFDPTAIEFGGVQQRRNDIKNMGRDVGSLTVVDLPHGAAFGLYSCNFADCLARLGPENRQGGSGAFTLARVILFATQPGLVEIKLDASRFVDTAGNPVEVAIDRATIAIQAGTPGEGRTYPAPGSMWAVPGVSPGDTGATTTQAGPFDLTGDGLVTHADVMETASAWELARLKGVACGAEIEASRDINQDNCIDVSDIQLVAAQITAQGDESGAAETPATPNLTLTVNSVGDEPDDNIGNGICHTSAGTCTLRAAILEANANPGADTIHFNIPGSGVQTIAITHQLPTLNDGSGGTTIDGYTQPGAAPNTDGLVSNATILVQIEGGGEDNYDGFVITSAGNVIRGLAIHKVRRSFWINGSGAHDNTIIGCFVGTNAAGNYRAPQFANFAHGFHLELGANSNYIGGVAPADRNVISGSGSHGVGIWHETSDANVIINNIIGLTPSGDNRLPNLRHGVDLNYGASSNLVGGPGPSEHNVISGNDHTGVEVSHSAATTDNYIIGNYIGVDVNGLGNNNYTYNLGRGVNVEDGVTNNVFAGNVIGKNQIGGFEINHSYTTGNIIYDNRIGVGIDGSNAGNINYGLRINSSHTTIGPGNIIAFNSGNGIRIGQDAVNSDADFNVITQNSTYSNGLLGIDIYPNNANSNDPGDEDDGANQQLNYPELVSASPLSVTGTACAGCWVEIFIADSGAGEHGQGMTFVGSTIAGNNGTFTANVSGVSSGNYLTATATDQDCNTSENSLNILVTGDDPPDPSPPPTTLPPCVVLPPEPTPTATLPPDVTATPTPTLLPDVTATPTPTAIPGATQTPPPTPTATLPPGGAPAVMLYLPALHQATP